MVSFTWPFLSPTEPNVSPKSIMPPQKAGHSAFLIIEQNNWLSVGRDTVFISCHHPFTGGGGRGEGMGCGGSYMWSLPSSFLLVICEQWTIDFIYGVELSQKIWPHCVQMHSANESKHPLLLGCYWLARKLTKSLGHHLALTVFVNFLRWLFWTSVASRIFQQLTLTLLIS